MCSTSSQHTGDLILDELYRLCPAKPQVRWQEERLLIQHGTLIEATGRGFTVIADIGEVKVEFPGGLNEEHYAAFGPLLTNHEKGELAKGVLNNALQIEWHDWDIALRLFRKMHGLHEEEWLASMVADSGFNAIAEEMRLALNAYRCTYRRPSIPLARCSVPVWNRKGCRLEYGNKKWTFRSDARNIIAILDALSSSHWQAVDVMVHAARNKIWLCEDYIRDAVNQLRHKTQGVLSWHRKGCGGVDWEAL